MGNTTVTSQTVPEIDPFLILFPHRWDYIFAPHPRPDESPKWQSEDRFQISDRHLQEGRYLYGVRFGTLTEYFMADIDALSPYHPKRDRFAVGRIMEALELLGITDCVAVTSSYSGGVHLYFPLPTGVISWQLASLGSSAAAHRGDRWRW